MATIDVLRMYTIWKTMPMLQVSEIEQVIV